MDSTVGRLRTQRIRSYEENQFDVIVVPRTDNSLLFRVLLFRVRAASDQLCPPSNSCFEPRKGEGKRKEQKWYG